MKGIILAGGLGSRLLPLTKTINKHMLPVYDRPMIFYPIETLVKGGVTDLAIVIGEHGGDAILKVVGDGKDFGLSSVSYYVQRGEGGIADALKPTREWVGEDQVVVCLGDNIFEDFIDLNRLMEVTDYDEAHIFLKLVQDPQRFGVVEFDKHDIKRIVEKPEIPPSPFAVTGLYIFPGTSLFDVIDTLKPSGRGELEITDVNNYYIQFNKMVHTTIDGIWTDAGTFDSLYFANTLMASRAKHKKHLNKFQKVMSVL